MDVETRETCQFFWKVLRQIRRIDVIFFADLFIHSLFYRNAAELHYRYEMCFCGKGVGVKKCYFTNLFFVYIQPCKHFYPLLSYLFLSLNNLI